MEQPSESRKGHEPTLVAYTYAKGRQRRGMCDVFLVRKLGDYPIAGAIMRLDSKFHRQGVVLQVPPALRAAAAAALEKLAREALTE